MMPARRADTARAIRASASLGPPVMPPVSVRNELVVPARGMSAALACALTPRSERGGRRVALLQEGGGMRGAFGAGVQAGLWEAGVPVDAFDALYGTSAGALNFMYWVSQRTRQGTRVYIDELSRAKEPPFFLYRNAPHLMARLAAGRPVINLHAVEVAMTRARPIDLNAVAGFHAPIYFPITHAYDLTTKFVDVRTLPRDDMLPSLLAAASVPVLANAYDLKHGMYIDGACGAPLPVVEAIAGGFTDLVVILTLPPPKGPAWYETLLLYTLAGRRGLHSSVALAVRAGRHARKVALGILDHPPTGVNITVIAPPARLIRSLEQDSRIIEAAVDEGVRVARQAVDLARSQPGVRTG